MLFLETKFLVEGSKALRMLLLEILHMSLAVCHHGQKASARVVVLRILLKMRGKLLNALRKYGNLHLRRARVLVMDLGFLDDLCLLGLRNHVYIVSRRGKFASPGPVKPFYKKRARTWCSGPGKERSRPSLGR